MEDKELLQVVEAVFTRAQKSGILELNEVPAVIGALNAIKLKIELVETLNKKIEELSPVKGEKTE